MGDLHSQLMAADNLIRSGNAQQAARLISALRREVPLKHWSRADHGQAAELCRRCGLFNLGMRALIPYLGRDHHSQLKPTPTESATYAGLLIKVGSMKEAIEILRMVPRAVPEVDLYLGFAHVTQWDYGEAAPHLQRYLEWSNLTPYQRAIGEVNLAAAWVALGRENDGRELLTMLLGKTEKNRWSLLHKNSLELSAQLALETGDYSSARKLLDQIDASAPSDKDELLIAKQRAILSLRLNEVNATKKLTHVRVRALELEHWETVRDCDYQLALSQRNVQLALRAYFGTPYTSYRRRLETKCQDWLGPLPSSWIYGDPNGRIFDIRQGRDLTQASELKPGQVVHRMFAALASDLYRPIRQGTLFSRVFPGQYYDPESSSQRIANVLLRWRRWCDANHVAFQVRVAKGFFQLQVPEGNALQLSTSLTDTELQPHDLTLERLQNLVIDGFSVSEAADVLHLGRRRAVDVLSWGVRNGLLLRQGKGPATSYCFTPSRKAAA